MGGAGFEELQELNNTLHRLRTEIMFDTASIPFRRLLIEAKEAGEEFNQCFVTAMNHFCDLEALVSEFDMAIRFMIYQALSG